MAYCATTVLPADVCAETITDSLSSMAASAARWKVSRVNGKENAGNVAGMRGSSRGGAPGGSTISCVQGDNI